MRVETDGLAWCSAVTVCLWRQRDCCSVAKALSCRLSVDRGFQAATIPDNIHSEKRNPAIFLEIHCKINGGMTLDDTKDRQSETTSESSTTWSPQTSHIIFETWESVRTNLTVLFLKCLFFFYKRTETNAKQTVRFNSRQAICLEHPY